MQTAMDRVRSVATAVGQCMCDMVWLVAHWREVCAVISFCQRACLFVLVESAAGSAAKPDQASSGICNPPSKNVTCGVPTASSSPCSRFQQHCHACGAAGLGPPRRSEAIQSRQRSPAENSVLSLAHPAAASGSLVGPPRVLVLPAPGLRSTGGASAPTPSRFPKASRRASTVLRP